MKGQMIESISVLKELLGRVPVVEDIQIADESEHGFTVILQERGSGSFEIHVTCLKRTGSPQFRKRSGQSVEWAAILYHYGSIHKRCLCKDL